MNIKEEHWSSLLLDWFDSHGRELPWRDESPRDPYKVWVSEIMLQQTKVETVRPYYDSWMERFPNIKSLAAASQDDVLRQWQGLGYYSRARNLHQAVQEVQAKYGGRVPDTKKEVRALKGVGDYTAGAILSLAYGKKEAAVDGNVLRILPAFTILKKTFCRRQSRNKWPRWSKNRCLTIVPGPLMKPSWIWGRRFAFPSIPAVKTAP